MMEMKKLNLKNILIMALALMAVTCTVAAVSADDVSAATITNQGGTLTLDGLQFKIPIGFTSVESEQDNSEAGDAEHMDGTQVDTEVSQEYMSTNGEKLDIQVGREQTPKLIHKPSKCTEKNHCRKRWILLDRNG
jgi:hypothetical protein